MPDFLIEIYGKIGGRDVLMFSKEDTHLVPDGYVKISDDVEKIASPGYIFDATGAIVKDPNYAPSNDEISVFREHEILQQFPITEQLEALTEAAMGRSEKLDALIVGIKKIKEKFPKPDTSK